MQDIEPPAIPFLFKLDAELQRSKFTVWRNVSWHDGSEVLLFAFKLSWFPFLVCPLSISVFVQEFDQVSADDVKSFSRICLKYVQRTVPKQIRSPWFTPYLCLPVMVSKNLHPDAIDLVCKKTSERMPFMVGLFAFPVLVNHDNKEVHYFKRKQLRGFELYWLLRQLADRLVVQNL